MSSKIKAIELTIPIPRSTRNLQRLGKVIADKKMIPISVRVFADDFDLIQQSAELTGLNVSEFIRWTTYYAAISVLEHHKREEYNEAQTTRKNVAPEGFK